eukprot:g41951.t1
MDCTVSSAEDLDEYAITVMAFISKRVEGCTPKRLIWMFPNWKPWMNREIHCLLKIRCVAFKLNDSALYIESRYELHKAIRDAKRQYWTKLEAQTNHMDTRCLWQGLNNITGYKMKQSKTADKTHHSLMLSMLGSTRMPVAQWHSVTCPDAPIPSVTTAGVSSAFRRGNPRKAMDLDRVLGHALRSCADQLAEVFTDIFNFSLLQAKVPTCFKKTTIIP